MIRNVAILLTATIDVNATSYVARRDPAQRITDYAAALKEWLVASSVQSLVFCENSAHDLANFGAVCKQLGSDRRVDLLSFPGNSFAAELGKGYGEMRIIAHALEHSKTLASADLILKVTGRLRIANGGLLFDDLSKGGTEDVFCDLRDSLRIADSRVFCGTPTFIRNYLLPLQHAVNDSLNVTFEHVLCRAVHLAMADGARWALLPRAPDIRGISGTSNVPYPNSLASLAKREAFLRLKRAVLAR